MPQIIVTADRGEGRGECTVMLRERVSAADFESRHFTAQLVERLGWAVGDAHALEQRTERPSCAREPGEPSRAHDGSSPQPRRSARVVTTAS